MKRKIDKLDVDDDKWREAVAREAIIRPLGGEGPLSPTEVKTAAARSAYAARASTR